MPSSTELTVHDYAPIWAHNAHKFQRRRQTRLVFASLVSLALLLALLSLVLLPMAWHQVAPFAKPLVESADQGLAAAQYNLGLMYAQGRGVAKDEARAVELCQAAADQGDAGAQCALGVMYATGRGAAKNEARAVELFQAAAEQGHATALFNLGNMYRDGRGVAKDEARAMQLYQATRARGSPSATCTRTGTASQRTRRPR